MGVRVDFNTEATEEEHRSHGEGNSSIGLCQDALIKPRSLHCGSRKTRASGRDDRRAGMKASATCKREERKRRREFEYGDAVKSGIESWLD
jgi:hypothetical protein